MAKLGRFDQLVEYRRPTIRPRWMTVEQYAALPERLIVRELRYWTNVVAFTSRRDRGHDAARRRSLSLEKWRSSMERRWEIETNFAHLKTTMQMDVLHCHTVQGVLKELLMFAPVYNLARLVILAAAREQHVPHERLSFVDALLAGVGLRTQTQIGTAHQPATPRPIRATRPQTSPQSIPAHDPSQTPASTTASHAKTYGLS